MVGHEHRDSKPLANAGNYLTKDTASHPRRQKPAAPVYNLQVPLNNIVTVNAKPDEGSSPSRGGHTTVNQNTCTILN